VTRTTWDIDQLPGCFGERSAKSRPVGALPLRLVTPQSPSVRALLLVATLDAGALEQLAVLLLGHPLAPLLDYRTHR
jgi:hypothetical protein